MNELYGRLVELVYTDDIEAQRTYLSYIADMRKVPVEYLMERGALFFPNNEYIHHYLHSDADAWGPGLYESDFCPWTLFAVLPIMDLVGDVVGLVGYDVQNKWKTDNEGAVGLPIYKVSSKLTFQRDKYFLTDIEVLKKEFSKRTILIVDGVFDSVSLNYRGLPAISLLGSLVSPEVLYFLRWYKGIYVIADNDTAGAQLFNRLSYALPGVRRVFQNKGKDIEQVLRGDGFNGPITKQLWDVVNNCPKDNIYLR